MIHDNYVISLGQATREGDHVHGWIGMQHLHDRMHYLQILQFVDLQIKVQHCEIYRITWEEVQIIEAIS